LENHDIQVELAQQRTTQQGKLVYYLIALSVAAIGFSVTQTINDHLSYSHIIVGISVLCWSGSVFCGLQFIKVLIRTGAINIRYLREQEGRKEKNTDYRESEIRYRKEIEEVNKRSEPAFNWQHYLFYLGLASFIAWHIIRMSQN
jgi:hypothetical protein